MSELGHSSQNYSSNKIRKTQNEHLTIVKFLMVRYYEFNAIFLFWGGFIPLFF